MAPPLRRRILVLLGVGIVLLAAGVLLIRAVAARRRLRSPADAKREQPRESPPNPVSAAGAPPAAPQAQPRAIQSQADWDAALRRIWRDAHTPVGELPETDSDDGVNFGRSGDGGVAAFVMFIGAFFCAAVILGSGYLTSYLLDGLDLTWPWLALWVLVAMTTPAIVVLLFLVPRTSELNNAAGVSLFGVEVLRVLAVVLGGACFAWLFRGEIHQFIAGVVGLHMVNLSDRIYLYAHESLWSPSLGL